MTTKAILEQELDILMQDITGGGLVMGDRKIRIRNSILKIVEAALEEYESNHKCNACLHSEPCVEYILLSLSNEDGE